MKPVIAFHLPSLSPTGCTIEQALIAPAFTSGVEGWSFSSRIAMIELKGSPVASAPIFVSTSCALYWFIARMAVGHFRYRFDAEFVIGVAHGDHLPVGQAGRDAEEGRR